MEVILKSVKSHPCCPHGPTLMFERYGSDGQKTGRKFYACSACRDRVDCNFFCWIDDKFSAQREEHWKHQFEKNQPPFSHDECISRLEHFKKTPIRKRMFCRTCSMLIILVEEECHTNHEVLCNIDWQLLQPSSLLVPLENKKSEAQYFFTENTTNFVVKLLKKLNFTRIISIGTPKIHEHIISKKVSGLSTMLLDIDHRYMQFFSKQQFCHYNLFNNCFFGGKPSKDVFRSFLSEDDGNGIVIILDPPFGGLVDAISYSLQKIVAWWRKGSKKESDEEIPVLWFFPYFNESRISKSMPSLKMMDYKVEYTNHKQFGVKGRKNGSAVRIFTNIKPSLFFLPEDAGYKFCDICQRYVSKENQHCATCKACTTKDGKAYKHCNKCEQCVKSSYEHCENCGKCVHVQHSCERASKVSVCHICSSFGHKRRDCPQRSDIPPKKKMKTI